MESNIGFITGFGTALKVNCKPERKQSANKLMNDKNVIEIYKQCKLRPLVLSVPDLVYPGYNFRVKGCIPTGSRRFAINFQCGAEPGDKSNIALHIDFRFYSNTVVCNTFTGKWETEEVHYDMPLTAGERFDVLIECAKDRFKITVNGKHYTDYKYRMPLDSISHLSILDDAMPIEVYFGDETQIKELQQAVQQQQQHQTTQQHQQEIQQQGVLQQGVQQQGVQQQSVQQQGVQQQGVQQQGVQQQGVQQQGVQQQGVQQQGVQQQGLQQQGAQQQGVLQQGVQQQGVQQQTLQQRQQAVQQQQQTTQQHQQEIQQQGVQQQGVQQQAIQQRQQAIQQQQQTSQQHQQGIQQENDAMFQCSPNYWLAPKDWVIVMPLMSPILEGVGTGMSFNVQGVAPSGSSRFSVNLQHGFDYDNITEVVFHLEFRFDYKHDHNVVVRNSRVDSWGPEEKDGGMPLSKQKPFDILIVCESTYYKVMVDGKHFTNFNHRIPVSRITHLAVLGDVMLSYAGYTLPDNMIE